MKLFSLVVASAIFASTTALPATSPVWAAPAPTFTSKKEKYSIDLPGQPKAASRAMPLPKAGQITVNYISVSKPPLSFVVIPMQLPGTPSAAKIEQFLDGVERGFTMSPAAKLVSRKKIALNGAPGREIVVKAGKNLMRARFFVKGSRSYQVVAISPQNGAAKYKAQTLQVLNSFRILK